jgi:hypothetical protein
MGFSDYSCDFFGHGDSKIVSDNNSLLSAVATETPNANSNSQT